MTALWTVPGPARKQGKSLNEVAIEALAQEWGPPRRTPARRAPLSDIGRNWRKDPAFDSGLPARDTGTDN